MPKPREAQKILEALLAAARREGADAADALFVESVSSSVSYRLGKLEDVERSESSDLGLRVFVGQTVAFVSSTDFSDEALAALPGRARGHGAAGAGRQIRRPCPAGPSGAHHSRISTWKTPQSPSAETLVERARDAERRGPGGAGRHQFRRRRRQLLAHAPSRSPPARAFSAAMPAPATASASRCWPAKAPAWNATMTMPAPAMPATCRSAEEIGRSAGEKAVSRLNPRKVKSQTVPVVFDPREAGGLARPFRRRDLRRRVARGVSFLKDRHGQRRCSRLTSPSSTIRTAGAACAPSRSTAKASPTSAAR